MTWFNNNNNKFVERHSAVASEALLYGPLLILQYFTINNIMCAAKLSIYIVNIH